MPAAPGPVCSREVAARSRLTPALVALALLTSTLAFTAAENAAATPPIEAGATRSLERIDGEQLLLVREAMNVVKTVGARLWRGWSEVPPTTLIVDTHTEFLIGLPPDSEPPPGFTRGDQEFMRAPIYTRDRELPVTLRTAFPIGDIPMAIVGAWQPEVETPNEWVVTLCQQWFHVLQLMRGEEGKVAALELSDVPSWQLELPFPEDPDVANAVQLLGQALYDFWARGSTLPREGQRAFLAETAAAALANLRTVITLKHGDDAYRYFRVATWRDGVGRYSSVQMAREIARAEILSDYVAVNGFGLMRGHQRYAQMWEETVRNNYLLIRTAGCRGEPALTALHAIGHGIAELLDAIDDDWKAHYFEPDVWLDDQVAAALGLPAYGTEH